MGELVTVFTERRPVAGVLVGGRADRGVLVAWGLFDLGFVAAHVVTVLNVQGQPILLHVFFIYFCCLQFFLGNISWPLLFLQLCHVDQVVLGGLAVGLAKVQFDCVFARKSPVAQLTLECGAQIVLGSPHRAHGLVGQDL